MLCHNQSIVIERLGKLTKFVNPLTSSIQKVVAPCYQGRRGPVAAVDRGDFPS